MEFKIHTFIWKTDNWMILFLNSFSSIGTTFPRNKSSSMWYIFFFHKDDIRNVPYFRISTFEIYALVKLMISMIYHFIEKWNFQFYLIVKFYANGKRALKLLWLFYKVHKGNLDFFFFIWKKYMNTFSEAFI